MSMSVGNLAALKYKVSRATLRDDIRANIEAYLALYIISFFHDGFVVWVVVLEPVVLLLYVNLSISLMLYVTIVLSINVFTLLRFVLFYEISYCFVFFLLLVHLYFFFFN